MTDKSSDKLLQAQEDALALIQSARLLSSARQSADKAELAGALDGNLRLWTGIQTLMKNDAQPLPAQIRENLKTLANFVVAKTLEKGLEISPATVQTLENINLQIAEGLLENLEPDAAEQNAAVLLEAVRDLNAAKTSENPSLTAQALNKNLYVWTAFLTLLKSGKSGIPQDAADNLKRLGHYIVQKTLEAKETDKNETLSLLANLNMQIAQGFLENRTLSPAQQDAFELLQAAVRLSCAKEKGDAAALTEALDGNLKLWTAIRTLMQQEAHPMAKEIKENLIRLADYTAQKTFEIGRAPQNEGLNTLINLNLQISEGLLERSRAA